MSVVVVATITPLPEYRDEVIAAYTATIPQVHAEDGCELYALHRNADKLVIIEKWADQAALDDHARSPALAGLGAKTGELVAEPMKLLILEAVPVGDPIKGAL